MDRQQRDRQPQERCQEHHPDLARIAGHRVLDELANVVEDSAPLAHGVDDRREVVVQQHHLGGLARHVRPLAPHRDADVGPLERRRIVDAVAGHRDELAPRLQRLDDANLLFRVHARVDARSSDALAQRLGR